MRRRETGVPHCDFGRRPCRPREFSPAGREPACLGPLGLSPNARARKRAALWAVWAVAGMSRGSGRARGRCAVSPRGGRRGAWCVRAWRHRGHVKEHDDAAAVSADGKPNNKAKAAGWTDAWCASATIESDPCHAHRHEHDKLLDPGHAALDAQARKWQVCNARRCQVPRTKPD